MIKVIVIILLLFFIKFHPLTTFIILSNHLFFLSFIFGEKIVIANKKIANNESANKIKLFFSGRINIEKIPVIEDIKKIKM